MKKLIHFLMLIILVGLGEITMAQTPSFFNGGLKFNGEVNTQFLNGNTLYVGGSFTGINLNTGPVATLDVATNKPANTVLSAVFAQINGSVKTVCEDGSGGYLIGGNFTAGSVTNLMRVNASGAVVPLTGAAINSTVNKIVKNGNSAFAVGNFGAVKIDLNSNSYFSFLSQQPMVNTALVYNNKLYLGGQFSTGAPLLKYDCASATLENSYTNISSGGTPNTAEIHALAQTNGNLYFGGKDIFLVNGQTRMNIGGINLGNQNLLSLSVQVQGTVSAIAITGTNVLYIGGTITSIKNLASSTWLAKLNLALINISANSVSGSWSPNPNGSVNCLESNNDSLYVGGSFTQIHGQNFTNLALYPTSSSISGSGPPISSNYHPNPDGAVNAVIPTGGNKIIGGDFNSFEFLSRGRAAAMDITTGIPTDFAPKVSDGAVLAIQPYGNDVFLGGTFTTSDVVTRNHFVAVNAVTGLNDNNIQINCNDAVRSISMLGSNLFLGGDFTFVSTPNPGNNGTLGRNYLASFTIGTYAVINSSFNGNLNNGLPGNSVNVVRVINNQVYVGGSFTSPQNFIAMLNPSSGTLVSSFDARVASWPTGYVSDICQVNASQIAIGGNFLGGFNQSINNNMMQCGLAVIGSTNGTVAQRNNFIGAVSKIVNPNNGGTLGYCTNNPGSGVWSFNLQTGISTNMVNTWQALNSLEYFTVNIRAISYKRYSFGGSFENLNNFDKLGFMDYEPALAPTISASNFSLSNVTYNSVRVNFTIGNGARRIVVAKLNGPPSSNPSNGFNYNPVSVYGDPSAVSVGGAQVIYDGTGNFADLTGLSANSNYSFRVYEYNGTGINTMYAGSFLSGSGSTLPFPAPLVSASNVTFSAVGQNSFLVSWSNGDGAQRLVVAKEGSAVDFVPTNNANFSSSSSFGSANLGNNNYGIYNGNGTGVFLTNLTPGITYHIAIYEYNVSGANISYKITLPATGNQTTTLVASQPMNPSTNISFTNLNSSTTRVSWTSGSGGKHLVLAVQGNYSNVNGASTANGTIYTVNSNYSSASPLASNINLNGPRVFAKVVYANSANSVDVSGLLAGTEYTYVVVEYNELPGLPTSANFLGNSVLSGIKMTDPNIQPPSLSASNPNSIENKNTIRFSCTNGNGNNRLIVIKQGQPVSWAPLFNTAYTGNANFSTATDQGSGNKVVYSGSGNTVDITNLLPYTTYHFAVYEYNSGMNSGTLQMEYAYKTSAPATYNVKTSAPNWPRIAGGSETDAAGGVAVDGSGNVYVAGTIKGDVNFGLTTVSATGNDIYLAKYSSTGDLVWLRTAGGTGDEGASSVIVDATGNIYMGGSIGGSSLFGTLSVTSRGSTDGFIAKYNSSGTEQWVRTFGDTGQDAVNSMTFDGLGNIIIGGFGKGLITFSGSATTVTTIGQSDLLVGKYDNTGALLWARTGGSSGYDFCFGVGVDQNNNVFACGEIKGASTFGTLTSGFAGSTDAILVKYNSSGVVQSATNYGSTGDDKAFSMDVDGNGQVYMVGAFSGTVAFGTTNLISAGVTDGFLVKIDGANGTVQWAKKQGGLSQEVASGIDIGGNGEIFVTGSFGGTANFDGQSLTSTGNTDIFVATYSATGLINVAKKFGGPLDDAARGIYALLPNNTYITGYFNASANFGGFEVFTKIQPVPPAGNWDAFVFDIGATYNADPSADLVCWYRFNGNANDFSGHNFHGSIESPGSPNTVTSTDDRNSVSGSAYDFAGEGRVDFSIPQNAAYNNLNEITVMAWVNATNFASFGSRMIIASDESDPMSFNLMIDPSQSIFGQVFNNMGNPSGSATSPQFEYPSGFWSHVAMTYENGIQTRVFLNGNVAGTVPFAISAINLSGKKYTIGAQVNSSNSPLTYSYYMNGGIDDVRIYKKALTSVQILDIMASASNVSSPPQESRNNSNNDRVSIWPNPNNGSLNFETTNESAQLVSFRIVDLSGKTVYSEDPMSYDSGVIRKVFDLQNLNNGYYTLQVVKGNEISNHKLILNK